MGVSRRQHAAQKEIPKGAGSVGRCADARDERKHPIFEKKYDIRQPDPAAHQDICRPQDIGRASTEFCRASLNVCRAST